MWMQKHSVAGLLVVLCLSASCGISNGTQQSQIPKNDLLGSPTKAASSTPPDLSNTERATRASALYSNILTKLFYSEDLLNASGLEDTLVMRRRTVKPEGLEELEKTDFPTAVLERFRQAQFVSKQLQSDYDVEFGLITVDNDETLEHLLDQQTSTGKKVAAAMEVSDLVYDPGDMNAGLYIKWIDRYSRVSRAYVSMSLSYRNIGNGITVTDISKMQWIRLGE